MFVLFVLLIPLAGAQDPDGYSLWPLVTPVMGNISSGCCEASKQYISLLGEALSAPLAVTDEQRAALKMFDSNGPLPFLQEGMLQDTMPVDVCDIVSGVIDAILQTNGSSIVCKDSIAAEVRVIGLPYGHANGPGMESECKNLDDSKYCHNYYSIYLPIPYIDNGGHSKFKPTLMDSKTNMHHHLPGVKELQTTIQKLPKYDHFTNVGENTCDIDINSLMDMENILINKSPYVKAAVNSIRTVLEVHPALLEKDVSIPQDLAKLALSLYLLTWWTINGIMNGAGLWPFMPQLASQGMCYPSACSKDDISANNIAFANTFFPAGSPSIVAQPLVPDYLAIALQVDKEMKEAVQLSAIGCSDDERYSGNWKAENYVMVTLLSIIGFLVFAGTTMEIAIRSPYVDSSLDMTSPPGLGSKLLMAFSLVSNLEFIFKVPETKKGSQRLDCLEGMRGISMTWVILGHSFAFGASLLNISNKSFIDSIYLKKQGLAIEAIMQGEYSVDTFLFIGATLVSYLLLKDLDKSNGWFHGMGGVRMFLFYLNRYLRLSIPYALAIGVYVGIIPLLLAGGPIASSNLAFVEAYSCKEYWWRHLTYSNIFGLTTDACIGQTWYLSCEMILFCLSPLVIYPLWRTKFSNLDKVIGITWWCCVFIGTISATVWYKYNTDYYEHTLAPPNNLPTWNFSPWGWRNQCYIIGLMTGYLLHITKDKGVKIHPALNLVIWAAVSVVAFLLVYGDYWVRTEEQYHDYLTMKKWSWGLCLAWITFACVRGYGGLINDFLSWGVWASIAKISFMTYLFHMGPNFDFFAAMGYNVDASMWLFTEIFVGQLFVDLFFGLLGCLILELPFGKVQKILIEYIFLSRK